MTLSVATLQERLEHRAKMAAIQHARNILENIPASIPPIKVPGVTETLNAYYVLQGLRDSLQEYYTQYYLKEETDRLLEGSNPLLGGQI